MSLLVDLARQAGLPWDAVFSAELVGHYKPDLIVYQKAAEWLSLPPEQVLMVAAHKSDLEAAKRAGLGAAFVTRPLERGGERKADLEREPWMDIYAEDFVTLAECLGA